MVGDSIYSRGLRRGSDRVGAAEGFKQGRGLYLGQRAAAGFYSASPPLPPLPGPRGGACTSARRAGVWALHLGTRCFVVRAPMAAVRRFER